MIEQTAISDISTPSLMSKVDALKIMMVWILLRGVSSAAALMASYYRPLYSSEAMSIWPPSAPLTAWLHRILVAPWLRWDAYTYQIITSLGYQPGQTQFHPLFAWLARP